MSVKLRMRVEREIVTKLVQDALAAGYLLGVNDGEETTLERSADVDAVLKALFTTDDDWLLFYVKDSRSRFGWVRLIYGNDGYDVISDYSVNLEHIMAGANAIANEYDS